MHIGSWIMNFVYSFVNTFDAIRLCVMYFLLCLQLLCGFIILVNDFIAFNSKPMHLHLNPVPVIPVIRYGPVSYELKSMVHPKA